MNAMPFLSRRSFLGGAAAFFAAGPLGAAEFGKPRIKFGVVTDVHFAYGGGPGLLKGWDSAMFRKSLEWFRDQGVDAVLCAGDIADRGLIDEMAAFAKTWFSVFPDDKRPDGGHVERVFVTGNHDFGGHKIYKGLPKIWPDPEELQRHVMIDRISEVWKDLFHEDYEKIFMKDVKGYKFIGSMWDKDENAKSSYVSFGTRISPFLAANASKLDPGKPFFYVQHPHPKDTCYGSWAWGHDDGGVTAALSKFPNAVAFSGHSHYSLTDERSIWQEGFTSVGAGSLRYVGMPNNEYKGRGGLFKNFKWIKKSSQGMLVEVYDEAIIYRKMEFMDGLELADAWVQLLPTAKHQGQFDFAERARKFAAPEFPQGAKLSAKKLKTGELELAIPAATVKRSARGYAFEIDAVGSDGTKKFRRIMAEGFNRAPDSQLASAPSEVAYSADDLPAAPVEFTVTPVNCFGNRGKPISFKTDIVATARKKKETT